MSRADDLRGAVKLVRQKIERARKALRDGDTPGLALELELAEIASQDAEILTEDAA